MATENNYQLPSPPTFSQMKEDLDTMSADDKVFRLEQDESMNGKPIEQTNEFLARLDTFQRLDTLLEAQNDSTNDQLEKKLKDIIGQLQMCLTKLQTNSFSNMKNLVTDNKK